MFIYDTVSEAVNGMVKRGYTHNFTTCNGGVECSVMDLKLSPDQFKITEVYRFEGNTDPADEAIVYGIESVDGIKGVLVNGYGASNDSFINNILKDLGI